ncbi:MAG: hypothetical protein JSS03_08580 [Proteobacteria bacterium]|nr:hypothetical protein [Pseudomonadota bacterium]
MAVEKLLHFVGLSDEDSANLRLALRAGKKTLTDDWAWGPEARADVIVVDARRLLGEAAKRRAQQRDVPCAEVVEAGDPRPNGLYLRRPFKRDALVALLNAVSAGNVTAASGTASSAWGGEDEIEFDMGSIDLSALESRYSGQRDAGAHRSDPDQLAAAAQNTADDLAIDLSRMPPLHGDDPPGDKPIRPGKSPAKAPGGNPAVAGAAVEEDFEPVDPKATYSFLDFFERRLLRVPSKLSLPGTPVLSVDPKARTFLTQGSLAAMETYARRKWRHAAWEPLSPSEAAALERSAFTKPTLALVWMYHFIHSKGMLSRKFNPNGDFALNNRFNVVVEYPLVHRVGTFLTSPRKLHEIARLARVDIDLVYDVINAYDAVGYVDGTLRA